MRCDGWLSFHLFCHTGDRDRLLLDLVRPTVGELLRQQEIGSFFFLRYALGGPHIRLRLLPLHGRAAAVRATFVERAAAYLAAHPSPAPLPRDEIVGAGAGLAAPASGAEAGGAIADNSLRETAFEPETERYGGAALLPLSLVFFALSSVRTLHLLSQKPALPRPRWMATAVRLMLDYALGFARQPGELKGLFGRPPAAAGPRAEQLRQQGDLAFESGREALVRLALQRFAALGGRPPALPDGAPARPDSQSTLPDSAAARWLDHRLAVAAPPASAPARARIHTSQLHLTANRLGLGNAEELYLAQILVRTLAEIEAAHPAVWQRLGEQLAADAADHAVGRRPGEDLLGAALSELGWC